MLKIKSGFAGERAVVLPIPIVEELTQNDLGQLLRITDIGFYPKAKSHYRSRTSAETSQYILIYCIEGEGWVKVKSNEYPVSANKLIIIPKGTAHSYGSKEGNPWSIYWLHFDGRSAPLFSEGFEKPVQITPSVDSRIEDRLKMFEEIYNTLRNGFSPSNLSYCISVLFHLLGSLKYIDAFRASKETAKNEGGIVEKSIHYMRENIHRRLTLNQLAEYSGLSTSHFTAVFQQKTSYPPIRYFLQLKMQHACHLLDFSDMKINQISSVIGFDDSLYFSRIFSSTMGLSPKEYRKKAKG